MKRVVFVRKPKTVAEFGCKTEHEFKTWVPEICGVCCLKMVGDTAGKTNSLTLWQLTKHCIDAGVFVVDGKEIRGAYHKPLLAVARSLGLVGRRVRFLPGWRLRWVLWRGLTPILSIDLDKLDPPRGGGHLIVVVGYKEGDFFVHDPSSVLAKNGEAARISTATLDTISNKRGFVFK